MMHGRKNIKFHNSSDNSNIHSSGMLLSVVWELVTDVSVQPIGHISKGQAVHEKKSSWTALPLKKTPIGFPDRRLCNCHSTLRNIPDERLSHLHRGGSLELHTELAFHSLANKKITVLLCGIFRAFWERNGMLEFCNWRLKIIFRN